MQDEQDHRRLFPGFVRPLLSRTPDSGRISPLPGRIVYNSRNPPDAPNRMPEFPFRSGLTTLPRTSRVIANAWWDVQTPNRRYGIQAMSSTENSPHQSMTSRSLSSDVNWIRELNISLGRAATIESLHDEILERTLERFRARIAFLIVFNNRCIAHEELHLRPELTQLSHGMKPSK